MMPFYGRNTVRARMPAYTEVFRDDATAPTACLTGLMGSDFDDRATSLFRFIAGDRDEGSPACIQNTLIQAAFGGSSVRKILARFILFGFWGFRHVVNLQILKHKRAILIHQLPRGLVEEITASVTYFAVEPGQGFLGTLSTTGALLASMDQPMRLFDVLFCVPIEAWVGNLGAIGEHGKGGDAQVNAYLFLRWMEGHGWSELILCGEHRIPLLTFSLDGTRFDLALDLSMWFDLDVSNLGEPEPPAADFIAPLRVGEAIIAVATFEPGVARGLAILHPTKKSVKGFVETLEDILLHLAMYILVLFSQMFDGRQLISLHAIGDRHATQLIGFFALLQGGIIQLFAPA